MTFRATVQLHGKTATGISVPPDVVAALGGGKRPAVTVTLNGFSYRSTVAPMRGEFLLPVSAEIRAASGVAAGDEVEVGLVLDTQPRAVEVPADLAAGLAADPVAADFFAGLSYSNQRRYVLWLESAKKAQTRAARVEQAVGQLREGRLQG